MSKKKETRYTENEYLILKDVKSLLRENEKVVALIPTFTPCKRFNAPGESAHYSIICTQNRIIIFSKTKSNEYSTSFGYGELSKINIIKGILKDKVRIHRDIYQISKRSASRLARASDYINIKLSIWKYPLYIIFIFALFALSYKGYLLISDFVTFGSFSPVTQNTQANPPQNSTAILQNRQPAAAETEKSLKSIVDGYQFVFSLIIKNYLIYITKPALSGDPSSSFDQWATEEVINTLDSQDSKLASLNIVLEKHVMVKLGISELRTEITKYLDLCKKTFTDIKKKTELLNNRERIEKKIQELQQILS